MCLTLPEVLISVVGIEKVVPTWEGLDPLLRLLPRSSTGERMNPYTSTWSGVTPGDGPQEVHVVLLDNGRTNALADEVGRQALRCIRCSACLNVCPVYERTGGHAYGSVYPGPIGAILNPLLRGVGEDEQVDSLPYASSLCGACFEVCPVLIDIPSVLVDLRAQVVDAHRGGVPSVEAARVQERRRRTVGLSQAPVRRAVHGHRPGCRPSVRRLEVDLGPQSAGHAEGVLPGLVEAHRRRATMTARDDILGRVRAALDGVEPGYDVPPAPRIAPIADLVAHFADRVADYRAVVERCTSDELAARVAAALPDGARVVVPSGLSVEVPGADEDGAGGRVFDAYALDAYDAVVTEARVGIAETGTIVLDHGPGQGRRAISLVPDLHVCIVRTDQVVPDVPDALPLLDPRRAHTWISGPSATSDIELDRVEGVHGPRTLHVLLVEPD